MGVVQYSGRSFTKVHAVSELRSQLLERCCKTWMSTLKPDLVRQVAEVRHRHVDSAEADQPGQHVLDLAGGRVAANRTPSPGR
jgi:hypothetical protein